VAGDFASELESIARELRRQADSELFRELTGAMRRGAESAKEQVRAGLDPRHPKRYFAGTLAPDLDLRVSVSTTGREPGVSLVARARTGRGRRALRRLDRGVLAHPLPGDDRERWFRQDVEPGFFTGPARDAEPEVTRNLEDALGRVADAVDRAAAGGR
jgi:hypothetical protein